MPILVPGPVPDATETRRGMVSRLAQSFGGLKRFVDGLRTSKVVFDDSTEQSTAAVLTSTGSGTPLVASALGVKSLGGTGAATVTATSTDVTVHVPSAVAPTLSDSGAGQSLIKTATGPAMALKRLVQGAGVTLTPTADGVTVAASTAATTLGSAGSGESIVEAGAGPSLLVSSFLADPMSRFRVYKSASRLVIGLEDTGFLDCTYYGPYTYQVRSRSKIGLTWTNWTTWSNAGTRNHAWVERAPGKVVARRVGVAGYIMGIVERNTNTELPTPANTAEYEEQFQWAPGHTPVSDRVIVGLPTGASPGVNWYTGTQNSWCPAAQQTAHPSGLVLASDAVYLEASAGPAAHSHETWLRVCHHWSVS